MAKLVLPGRDKQTTISGTPSAPLRVTVINGDLSFIRQPLLIGHYRSLRFTGTEKVMNDLIGGTMMTALRLGLYPVAIGTHQLFMNHNADRDNPWRLPRPQAVIVAGLGEEGKLRADDLRQTVRQATLAWTQRSIENPENSQIELAATLIGSGGSGISAGQSAQVIAQAVREANDRLAESNAHLRKLNEERKQQNESPLKEWPTVGHVYLVELYLDRAREAWRALQVQAAATTGYDVTDIVQPGHAALTRPIDSGYRGADYDFMSAVSGIGPDGDAVISFTLDTKRARSEVRAHAAQADLLRELLRQGWTETQNAQELGRTLFKLLIPVEMESFLSGSSEMQIELDSGTAGIPWELLDAGSDDDRNVPWESLVDDCDDDDDSRLPWSIRTKLLRKLRTADFKEQTRDAAVEDGILIIGEPRCDTTIYPRLPAARREAAAVCNLLSADQRNKVCPLISPDDPNLFGPDAREVTKKLMNGEWRIVHIAGHGEPPLKIGLEPQKPGDPPQKPGDPRGVVLSNGLFLGPTLIGKMRPVPELVFINCCHLATGDSAKFLREDESLLGKPYDRASFASSVAEELIKLGVRCVIAAGWAVGDKQAQAFATKFYMKLLAGERFSIAVAAARKTAMKFGGNTWAAYQCYGDPDWTFHRGPADAQGPATTLEEEFAGIASSVDLEVALETLAVQTNFRKADRQQQSKKIRHLEDRFGERWKGNGAVAEAFGKAYASINEKVEAIRWYKDALAANDGGASIKAAEQLGNLRVRLASETVDKVKAQYSDNITANHIPGELLTTIEAEKEKIDEARELLESLRHVQTSIERQSLCGSAWKRMALINRITHEPEKESTAIQRMYECYLHAEALARESKDENLFYPAMNRMAAEIIINAGKTGWVGLHPDALTEVRDNLAAKMKNDPDFWSSAGLVELDFYQALAHRNNHDDRNGKLAAEFPKIKERYEDLYARVNSMGMWSSVYDQARFVLEKYAENVSEQEEKCAANKLLNLLKQMATGTRG